MVGTEDIGSASGSDISCGTGRRNRRRSLRRFTPACYMRESREIERLRQVARWVEQDECQVAAPCWLAFWRPAGPALRSLLVVPARRQSSQAAGDNEGKYRSGGLVAGERFSAAASKGTGAAAGLCGFLVRREFAVVG